MYLLRAYEDIDHGSRDPEASKAAEAAVLGACKASLFVLPFGSGDAGQG